MFDRIAPRYDLLNHLLSAGIDTRWRKRAVDFLDLREPARILDLCTGTADLLIEALGRDPSHRGVGADFSGEMLIRAARKLERRGMASRSGLVCGDGEALPFARGSFDGALLAFGIRNIADPSSALLEVRQALRPGGRLVVLEFSMPKGPLGVLYRVYFREILPRVGALVSGDGSAYSYLPASVARFPGPEEFAALMKGAGFGSISWRELSGGIAHLYRGEA